MVGSQDCLGELASLWIPTQFSEELPMHMLDYFVKDPHTDQLTSRAEHVFPCQTQCFGGVASIMLHLATSWNSEYQTFWKYTSQSQHSGGLGTIGSAQQKTLMGNKSGHESSFNMASHMKCPFMENSSNRGSLGPCHHQEQYVYFTDRVPIS